LKEQESTKKYCVDNQEVHKKEKNAQVGKLEG
jgi:hypothetical protein